MTETGTPVTCSNCGSAQVRVYCAECGERQPTRRDFTATALAAEAASDFVSVDGRFWRSVVALLSKPGFLTQEYFAGRRTRFMRPFALFVMLNVAFFFVQPYTGLFQYTYEQYVDVDGRAEMAKARRRKLQLTEVTFARRFEAELSDQKKSILLFAIPVFAVVLTILYVGSGRTFVEHLVFSIHSYAFMVFYMLAIATLGFLALGGLVRATHLPTSVLKFLSSEMALLIAIGAGMVAYLQAAMRRYYGSGRAVSIARALVLFFTQGFLIATFHTALFHTVLLSL